MECYQPSIKMDTTKNDIGHGIQFFAHTPVICQISVAVTTYSVKSQLNLLFEANFGYNVRRRRMIPLTLI